MYRSPGSLRYTGSDLKNKLYEVLYAVTEEKKEILLLGDLNCNFLQSSCKRQLKQVFCIYGLKQIIQNFTRIKMKTQLAIDVVFSSNPKRIMKSSHSVKFE